MTPAGGVLVAALVLGSGAGCRHQASPTPGSRTRGGPAAPKTTTTRGDDGRCTPEPREGDACAADDGWCVLSWGEPGGWSEALWCRDGRWVLEREANLPPED